MSMDKTKLIRAAEKAWQMLASCEICPRRCKVNRLKGERGICRTGERAIVYSFMAHHGEEPPISGTRGSGTIFFANCNMSCAYCQNFQFSQTGEGRELATGELASLMLELQQGGCHNINLVTPTHVMPQILKALLIAQEEGLSVPIVYNTSGYELPEVIAMLDGIVDVYLADMRYSDPALSKKYSGAADYPQVNQASVKEMHRQVGIFHMHDEIAHKGLIIRHLVLPHNIAGTEEIMRFLAEKVSDETYVSLMSQYTPCHLTKHFPAINRRLSKEEFADAEQAMERHGLHNGWTQESGGLPGYAGINIKPSFDKE